MEEIYVTRLHQIPVHYTYVSNWMDTFSCLRWENSCDTLPNVFGTDVSGSDGLCRTDNRCTHSYSWSTVLKNVYKLGLGTQKWLLQTIQIINNTALVVGESGQAGQQEWIRWRWRRKWMEKNKDATTNRCQLLSIKMSKH